MPTSRLDQARRKIQVESWRIEERQEAIAQRGLDGWPKDSPEDLEEIERLRLCLRDLPDPPVLLHPIHPIKLRVDVNISPTMAYYFLLGDYEESDLELIEAFICPGDRVVECGGGAGITGAFAAHCSGNSIVLVEPSERMHSTILGNFEANGESCKIIGAAVVPDGFEGDYLKIHINEEYWWTTTRTNAGGRPEPVPVIRISELLRREQPTVLLMDIEGAEVGLLPKSLPADLRLIIAELHTPDIGDEATAEIVNSIVSQGFKLKRIKAQTWVFGRD